MANAFLIQISGDSYKRLVETGTYENPAWARKKRDSAQGEVEPGDSVLFYCTGAVPEYSQSLGFSAPIESVSPDKTVIRLAEIRWFRSPLARDRILEAVSNGDLEEAFQSCGVQGFNITKLQPQSLAAILELVEAGEGPPVRRAGPLDALIETKLEEYILQNWSEIDFGSRLRLHEEDGEPVGQQYDTGEIGRIDLLCEDAETGDIVIIELKRGRPSDEVIGQLARYMGWAQEKMSAGRRVRGIVLAPDFDAKLWYAARAIPGVDLLRYRVRFEIHPAHLHPE
jgi:hypothetical protein